MSHIFIPKAVYGVLIGLAVGLFVVATFYYMNNFTDCFKCGFMGIDFCEFVEGSCPYLNTYRNFVMIASIPIILAGSLYYFVFVESGLLSVPPYHFISVVFVLYVAGIGYLISKRFT